MKKGWKIAAATVGAGIADVGRVVATAVVPLQAAAIIAVVAGTAGTVAYVQSRDASENALIGPLVPVQLAGDVGDDWADDFDIPVLPKVAVKQMMDVAEVRARRFRTGDFTVVVSAVRGAGLEACSQMVAATGQAWDQALCPARVSLRLRSGARAVVASTACMPPEGTAEATVTASFDSFAGTVTLSTAYGGKSDPQCERVVHLPSRALAGALGTT